MISVVGGSAFDLEDMVEEVAGIIRMSEVGGGKEIYHWAPLPPIVPVIDAKVVAATTAVVRMVVLVVLVMLGPKYALRRAILRYLSSKHSHQLSETLKTSPSIYLRKSV